MLVASRYRLYPRPSQVVALDAQLETLRRLWNRALEERQETYRATGVGVPFAQQCKSLTTWRKDDAWLSKMNAQVCQAQLARLDAAFKRFFKGNAAYPRFKAVGEQSSLTHPQAYGGSARLNESQTKLAVSKVGHIPCMVHRAPPVDAKLKTCTIKREGTKWYAVLVHDAPITPAPRVEIKSSIGIDLGLTSLVALSNGEVVASPKFLAKSLRRLKRAQQSLSRKQRGSRNRLKQKTRLQCLAAKIARQRSDHAHKLSHSLTQRFDLIATEDLRVPNMVRSRRFARSISDAAWGQLRLFLKYKAERAGKTFIMVPARDTTQTCSACGKLAEPRLQIQHRIHSCPCGKSMGRDENAAKNILARGLAAINTPGHGGLQACGADVRPTRKRRQSVVKQEPLLGALHGLAIE